MKQKLLKLSMLIGIMLMGINAWGDDTKTITLVDLGANLSSTSNTTMSTTTITATEGDSYTLNYFQGKKQGSAILLAKSTGAFISNNTAIPGDITSVEVFINSGAAGKTTYHCAFSTTECKTAYTTGSTAVNITGGSSNVYTNSVTGARYFCISLGNANNGQVLKVVVTYTAPATGKTSTTTSFASDAYSAYIGGEAFTAPTASVKAGDDAVAGATVTYSSSATGVATVDASTGAVTLVGPGTATIKASYAGDDTHDASSASYTLTVGKIYASLADLVADGAPTTAGYPVKVTLTDEAITNTYTTKAGVRCGLYVKSGEQDVEIFVSGTAMPTDWAVNGTLSGTIEGTWKLFGSTWEVCPANWNGLSYTAPAKSNATITLGTYKSSLIVGYADDEYTVSTDGNGELSVVSSDPDVASVTISEGNVTVSAKAAGTTTITISSAETTTYNAATKSYTLRVTVPANIPFSFDGGKADVATTAGMSHTGLGSDYKTSPNLKFDDNGDNLVINFDESAKFVYYTIKGNGSSSSAWVGKFEVLESANGTDYSSVKTYENTVTDTKEAQVLNGTFNEIYLLKDDSRFIKFVYTTKTAGNVALGNIKISNEYVTTTANGTYGTICLPFAFKATDATVYSVSGVENATLSLASVEEPVAGTPYIYQATADNPSFVYTTGATVSNPVSDTYLMGTFESTSASEGAYVLQTQDGVQAFYKVGSEVKPKVPAYHASLLLVDYGDEVKIVGFDSNDADAINAVNVEKTVNGTIYNVNGQQMNKLQKGINIVNGKKYFVK